MKFAKDILEEKYLYKFREIAKDSSDNNQPDKNKLHYIERIFTHNELYFPSPNNLNDPLECRPLIKAGDLSDPVYKKKYISYAMKGMIAHSQTYPLRGLDAQGHSASDQQKIITWLNSHTQEQAQNLCDQQTDGVRNELGTMYRICSFSAVNNNPLLWSHYSDSHQGFCLVFDADNEEFGGALKVNYQDEYPILDFTEDDENEVIKHFALTKFTDWGYEKEFRLASTEPTPKDGLPVVNNIWTFPPEYLKGVILGARISDYDRGLIENLCRAYSSEMFIKQATLHDDNFYMKIIDL